MNTDEMTNAIRTVWVRHKAGGYVPLGVTIRDRERVAVLQFNDWLAEIRNEAITAATEQDTA